MSSVGLQIVAVMRKNGSQCLQMRPAMLTSSPDR
jgi:hypothetical protein